MFFSPKQRRRGPWDKKGDLKGTQIHKKVPWGTRDPIGHSAIVIQMYSTPVSTIALVLIYSVMTGASLDQSGPVAQFQTNSDTLVQLWTMSGIPDFFRTHWEFWLTFLESVFPDHLKSTYSVGTHWKDSCKDLGPQILIVTVITVSGEQDWNFFTTVYFAIHSSQKLCSM